MPGSSRFVRKYPTCACLSEQANWNYYQPDATHRYGQALYLIFLTMKIPGQQSLPLCTQTVHPAKADKQEPVNTGNGSTATQTAGLPHLHDLKRSRPAWLKQALFCDDTAVHSGKGLCQESSSSRRWEDDLSGAPHSCHRFSRELLPPTANAHLQANECTSPQLDGFVRSSAERMQRYQNQSPPVKPT